MRYRYAVCVFLAAYIFQTTLMNAVSVFGVTPNLLLCLVVVYSFLYHESAGGPVFGVVFGLLYDIAFMPHVGVAAMAFLIVSVSIMIISSVMNKEMIASVIIITPIATTVYVLIYWAIMLLLGSNHGFLFVMGFLPYYIAYNTVVVVVLYLFMVRKVIRHRRDRYYYDFSKFKI